MGIEIERKFLIYSQKLPSLYHCERAYIRQGYISVEPTVRVRCEMIAQKGWITIKGAGMLSRSEFEYEIPYTDATELFLSCEHKLYKTRYRLLIDGKTWEIDEFLGKLEGLWIAEIELKSEDEEFTHPAWLGQEVTFYPHFTNVHLAQRKG